MDYVDNVNLSTLKTLKQTFCKYIFIVIWLSFKNITHTNNDQYI